MKYFLVIFLFGSSLAFGLDCNERLRFGIPDVPQRRLRSIDTLKTMTLNMQNLLFRHVPNEKFQALAGSIRSADPDIVIAQEVSFRALKKLSRDYLGNDYFVSVIKGNDRFGKEVGFLIKADLPFFVDFRSHKNFRFEGPHTVFSRDLPAALFSLGPKQKPFLIVLGTHLKAFKNQFVKIRHIRHNEIQAMVQIAGFYMKRFRNVPIVLAGDFNNDLRFSPEFQPLNAIFQDSLEVAGVSSGNRATSWYRNGPRRIHSQPDGILISRELRSSVIRSWVQPFAEDASHTPDHAPVILEISTQRLWPHLTVQEEVAAHALEQ